MDLVLFQNLVAVLQSFSGRDPSVPSVEAMRPAIWIRGAREPDSRMAALGQFLDHLREHGQADALAFMLREDREHDHLARPSVATAESDNTLFVFAHETDEQARFETVGDALGCDPPFDELLLGDRILTGGGSDAIQIGNVPRFRRPDPIYVIHYGVLDIFLGSSAKSMSALFKAIRCIYRCYCRCINRCITVLPVREGPRARPGDWRLLPAAGGARSRRLGRACRCRSRAGRPG